MTSNAQRESDEGARERPTGTDARDRANGADTASLDELRSLLVGREIAALDDLTDRFESAERLSSAVSAVLPTAVDRSLAADERLAGSLQPVVEHSLRESVRRDPRVLVDALFPVMGPAIRKAVAAALGEMVQSLNRTLEHSFSIRGLRWRLEAMRTGKAFAEIVLLHSLVYRVEQVFLIHSETGLLLQHVVAPSIAAPDGDLVSGMLTAIQDFVRDSLGADQGEGLDAVRVGALTIWIERGPSAAIAAVIRGEAPADLRHDLIDALDAVHAEQAAAFREFEGDAAPFEQCRPRLEACFQARYEAEPTRPSPLLLALGAVLVVTVLGLTGLWLWHRYEWNSFVDRLRGEPGIVVTDTGTRSGKYYVAGLRDPLAADPDQLLAESGVDRSDVESRWEPYQSSVPAFALQRARALLEPPPSVTLRVENGALVAEGVAQHAWVADARRLTPMIAGIGRLDETRLVDTEGIDQIVLRFQTNTAELIPGQESVVRDLVDGIRKVFEEAARKQLDLRIEIVGRTDSSGDDATNSRLSDDRARRVLELLTENGIDGSLFTPVGVATSRPLRAEITPEDAAFNRSVTVRIVTQHGSDGHP